MNSQERHLELLRRYLDGMATEEETRALEEVLRRDAALRRQFLRYANLDAALGGGRLSPSRCESGRAAAGPGALFGEGIGWGRYGGLPGRSWRSVAATAAALVAGLMLVALVIPIILPGTSAAATLRHALEVHRVALDRCYRLEVRLDPEFQRISWLPAQFESRLWTRGDRFWIESSRGESTVAWGREANGDVWVALSPEQGVRLDADEVGERLALNCDLRSLQIESLLRAVLADFELRREPGSASSELIHASLKVGRSHPLYRAALLEVDTRSGVLRRVVLDRAHGGRQVATTTFTLTETSLLNDASYTLAGHLAPDATIYDRHHEPLKRRELLTQFLNTIRWSPNRN